MRAFKVCYRVPEVEGLRTMLVITNYFGRAEVLVNKEYPVIDIESIDRVKGCDVIVDPWYLQKGEEEDGRES